MEGFTIPSSSINCLNLPEILTLSVCELKFLWVISTAFGRPDHFERLSWEKTKNSEAGFSVWYFGLNFGLNLWRNLNSYNMRLLYNYRMCYEWGGVVYLTDWLVIIECLLINLTTYKAARYILYIYIYVAILLTPRHEL
jgi:hypothetical protein